MIERYRLPAMTDIWSEENKFKRWIRVELEASREFHRLGVVPAKDWAKLELKLSQLAREGVSPKAILEVEQVTRHDVIAFTTVVAKKLGAASRFLHFGLTSSDVVDTALAMAVSEAGALIQEDLLSVCASLQKRAREFMKLPTIGRTHGVFAEPTSFGLKFLGWYEEMTRNSERVNRALASAAFGKLSGAVGANSHLAPESEARILKPLGLQRESVSTQVIPRDRLAEVFCAFGILGSSIERIAVELRHLQRSEVSEVRENFSKKQKGSSAMPHKRNPITSENLTGIARILRSYVVPALENIPLWHERDISHSSVERVIIPDAFMILDFALNRLAGLIDGLVVDPSAVTRNLDQISATSLSGHLLLALVRKGVLREEGYVWVQRCAHQSMDEGGNFLEAALSNRSIRKHLDESEIREILSLKYALRNVPEIYKLTEKRTEKTGRKNR